MQLGRLRADSCIGLRPMQRHAPLRTAAARQPVQIVAKFGGGKGGADDAARKALEKLGGGGKGPGKGPGKGRGAGPSKQQQQQQRGGGGAKSPTPPGGTPGLPKPPAAPGGGGFAGLQSLFSGGGRGAGGPGGSGGGGGGGGWNWGGAGEGDENPAERPILTELRELLRGCWVVFWNAALFLVVADVLHRSLDWCCQVELLFLVGAPTQAFERLAGKWYELVEWVEKNMLGWKLPVDDEEMPMYKNLALYYPEEHAYTFDQYKYPLNEAEKRTLKRYHALRWWERDGGFAGDVTAAEVRAIRDKYNPQEADLRAYRQAKATGQLDAYWAGRREQLKRIVGSDELPGVAVAAGKA